MSDVRKAARDEFRPAEIAGKNLHGCVTLNAHTFDAMCDRIDSQAARIAELSSCSKGRCGAVVVLETELASLRTAVARWEHGWAGRWLSDDPNGEIFMDRCSDLAALVPSDGSWDDSDPADTVTDGQRAAYYAETGILT